MRRSRLSCGRLRKALALRRSAGRQGFHRSHFIAGRARVDAIREVRITGQTYYRWRKQYGGMGTDQLRELKRLRQENDRLRKAVSDLNLDKLILKEAARGNF